MLPNPNNDARIEAPASVVATDSEPEIVTLKSPMTIAANTKITIVCNSAVKMLLHDGCQVFISAEAPTTLTAPTSMTISPFSELGAEFATGWNKLPEELKLHVVSFNLISECAISHVFDYGVEREHEFHNQAELHTYLAMGPEIARLAHDVFYKQNHFFFTSVSIDSRYHSLNGMWLPPRAVRPTIRSFTLTATMLVDDWHDITRLASQDFRFSGLTLVYIELQWRYGQKDLESFLKMVQAGPICFSCEGEIEFKDTTEKDEDYEVGQTGLTKQDIECLIEENILFEERS